MSQTYNKDLPESGVTTFGELYQVIRDKDEALRSMFSGTSFPSNPVEGQPCYRTDRQKWYGYTGDTSLGENGWVEIASENEGLGAELINARGSKPSLDQRLDVALNEDGTLKANVEAYQSEWVKPSLNFTYVDSSSFKVEGDQTDIYVQYRALKFNHSTSSTSYSYVVSSSYSNDSNDETLVTVNDSVIQSDLVSVEHGLINADETRNSLPRNINADKVDNFDASQTPQANQIPVLNSSGQLWLPFTQTPILINGQDMMSREFYVDAVNGDDNNDGSESAPFKTIQKAIDSVPIGGYGGFIYLIGNHEINTDIDIANKFLWFWIEDNVTINFLESSTAGKIYSIRLKNSVVYFSGNTGKYFTFNLPTPSDNVDSYFRYALWTYMNGFYAFVRCNFYIPNDTNYGNFYLVGSSQYSGSKLTKVAFDDGTIYTDSTVIDCTNQSLILNVRGTTVKSYDGSTDREWSDIISGIVKDANGVPRNIISNLVF